MNNPTDYRLDGSRFLFWEFLGDVFNSLLAAVSLGTFVYMFVSVARQALPGLMAILKAV